MLVEHNNETNNETELGAQFRLFNPHLVEDSSTELVVCGFLIPIFGGFGILANLLVFWTLFHKNTTRGATPLSLLLQCLAGYDSLVAALSIWIFSVPTLLKYLDVGQHYLSAVHPYWIVYLYPVLHMGITGSDYLNLASAVERYIALDRFFKDEEFKTKHTPCVPRNTMFYIFSIFICTISFNIPLIFEKSTTMKNESDVLEVVPTALSQNEIYIRLYRLTLEFLVFKATPWISFLILFLSLKDRLKYYFKKGRRRTLTMKQGIELLDSRIILGINTLFYVTNILPLYISFCHILLFHVSSELDRIASLMIVLNSSFKIIIYLTLSHDFRSSLKRLIRDDFYHWMHDEDKNKRFLGHAKVASFVVVSKR